MWTMTEQVIVFVTCETKEQAERIAGAVVSEKLAACVNLVPGVRSCYVWEEKLTWSDEVMCVIKTTRGRFDELAARVRGLHSYGVPEIVAVGIEDADRAYSEWIDERVRG